MVIQQPFKLVQNLRYLPMLQIKKYWHTVHHICLKMSFTVTNIWITGYGSII